MHDTGDSGGGHDDSGSYSHSHSQDYSSHSYASYDWHPSSSNQHHHHHHSGGEGEGSSSGGSLYGGIVNWLFPSSNHNDETTTNRSFVTANEGQPQTQHAPSPAPSIPSASHRLSSHLAQHNDHQQRQQPSTRPSSSSLHPNSAHNHRGGGSGGKAAAKEDDLPSFSRWSPTWQSGGVNSSGRGYTSHPPAPDSVAPLPHRHHEHFPEEDDDEDGDVGRGGWIPDEPYPGEFNDVGGTYKLGVGYSDPTASTSTPTSKKDIKKQKRLASKLKQLEKDFGRFGFATGDGGGVNEESVKERIKRAKIEMKREKEDLKERSGVDEKGRLVVMGPKKRASLRWFQAIGAIVVGFGSIGSGILTHPTGTPSPDHTIPLYLLYVFPVLSLLLTTYLFLIRPYCLRRSLPTSPHSATSAAGGNHIVVPLLQGQQPPGSGGGYGCCGGKSRKVPNKYVPNGAVAGGQTVNLLVDPAIFATLNSNPNFNSKQPRKHRRRHRRPKRTSNSDSSSSDSEFSWSSDSSSDTEPRQQNFLSPHVLEARWKEARSWQKKLAAIDFGLGLVWLAIVAWSLIWGKRCTPGTFQGWCNFYNTALAFSVFVCLAFFTSFAFDCLDLRRTRTPPRLRMNFHA